MNKEMRTKINNILEEYGFSKESHGCYDRYEIDINEPPNKSIHSIVVDFNHSSIVTCRIDLNDDYVPYMKDKFLISEEEGLTLFESYLSGLFIRCD